MLKNVMDRAMIYKEINVKTTNDNWQTEYERNH